MAGCCLGNICLPYIPQCFPNAVAYPSIFNMEDMVIKNGPPYPIGVWFLHISAPQNHPWTSNWGILLGCVGLQVGSPNKNPPTFVPLMACIWASTALANDGIFLWLMACRLHRMQGYKMSTMGCLILLVYRFLRQEIAQNVPKNRLFLHILPKMLVCSHFRGNETLGIIKYGKKGYFFI